MTEYHFNGRRGEDESGITACSGEGRSKGYPHP